MTFVIVIAILLAIAAIAALLVMRGRPTHDGVDSFRRQIDALSPEARRPVIDQVRRQTDPDESDDDDDEEDRNGT